jgi:hypothetical protein
VYLAWIRLRDGRAASRTYSIKKWGAGKPSGSPSCTSPASGASFGDFMAAHMPTVLGEVSGTGIIQVDAAPVTLSLVNAGLENLNLSGRGNTQATLTLASSTDAIALMVQRLPPP